MVVVKLAVKKGRDERVKISGGGAGAETKRCMNLGGEGSMDDYKGKQLRKRESTHTHRQTRKCCRAAKGPKAHRQSPRNGGGQLL